MGSKSSLIILPYLPFVSLSVSLNKMAQQGYQQMPQQGGYQQQPQQGGYQQPAPQQGSYQQPPPQQGGFQPQQPAPQKQREMVFKYQASPDEATHVYRPEDQFPGLFTCIESKEDIINCLIAHCCPIITSQKIAEHVGEESTCSWWWGAVTCCCTPHAHGLVLSQKLRAKHGFKEEYLINCLKMQFCSSCQLAAEQRLMLGPRQQAMGHQQSPPRQQMGQPMGPPTVEGQRDQIPMSCP